MNPPKYQNELSKDKHFEAWKKSPGVESHYFSGNQDKMIEAYLKNLHLLSVFTDQETLQKQYDDLKQKHVVGNEELKAKIAEMEADKAKQQEKQQADMKTMKSQIENLMNWIKEDVESQKYTT